MDERKSYQTVGKKLIQVQSSDPNSSGLKGSSKKFSFPFYLPIYSLVICELSVKFHLRLFQNWKEKIKSISIIRIFVPSWFSLQSQCSARRCSNRWDAGRWREPINQWRDKQKKLEVMTDGHFKQWVQYENLSFDLCCDGLSSTLEKIRRFSHKIY